MITRGKTRSLLILCLAFPFVRVSSHSLFFFREVYEQMVQKYRDKGRTKGTKGECISSHQLQAAYEEYDEGATVFVFRMKSLKQGQSRSLLTQAARHHAAQVLFSFGVNEIP